MKICLFLATLQVKSILPIEVIWANLKKEITKFIIERSNNAIIVRILLLKATTTWKNICLFVLQKEA